LLRRDQHFGVFLVFLSCGCSGPGMRVTSGEGQPGRRQGLTVSAATTTAFRLRRCGRSYGESGCTRTMPGAITDRAEALSRHGWQGARRPQGRDRRGQAKGCRGRMPRVHSCSALTAARTTKRASRANAEVRPRQLALTGRLNYTSLRSSNNKTQNHLPVPA
jgi:hypothetical protein